MMKKALWALAALVAAGAALWWLSRGPTHPRRLPVGEVFPSVEGRSLAGEEYRLPADLLGAPAVLLIGYRQNTQFDLDRWLLGMQQARLAARVFELPTIPGLLPGLYAEKIDQGMRKGIPSEDWASVVTVYDDAERIARFTGNENPLPGRILALDEAGNVVFFHDEGYSVGALTRLQAVLASLPSKSRDVEGAAGQFLDREP